MSNFRLEKWYLDLSDSTGNTLICYSASVSLASIALNYNGYTFRSSKSSVITKRNSFIPATTVRQSYDSFTWSFLGNKAKWKKVDESIEELLLANEDGEIRWLCECPKGRGWARLNGEGLQGDGYVEKIVITIPPWRIPIKELHWGRFLSDGYTVIWIRWIGQVPKSLLFINGKKIVNSEISTDRIVFADCSLSIHNKRTLRRGTVLSTVFSKFKVIRNLFPKKIMSLYENKWVSDGVLSIDGREFKGSVIHEVVVWP